MNPEIRVIDPTTLKIIHSCSLISAMIIDMLPETDMVLDLRDLNEVQIRLFAGIRDGRSIDEEDKETLMLWQIELNDTYFPGYIAKIEEMRRSQDAIQE